MSQRHWVAVAMLGLIGCGGATAPTAEEGTETKRQPLCGEASPTEVNVALPNLGVAGAAVSDGVLYVGEPGFSGKLGGVWRVGFDGMAPRPAFSDYFGG